MVKTEQAVIEQVAKLSAEVAVTRKRFKGEKPKSKTPIKQNCQDCKTEYMAEEQIYDNGEIVITPKRCEPCQCAKVTEYRVDIIVDKVKLLGNLKTRIVKEFGKDGLQAVLDELSGAITELADRYSGTSVKKVGGFSLKKTKT